MGLGYLAALFAVIAIVEAVLIYLSRSVRREFRIEDGKLTLKEIEYNLKS